MSGFSADWLALREVADRSARSRLLIARLLAHFDSGATPRDDAQHGGAVRKLRITDLGCGTGATLRALDPYLPKDTQWRLVDADALLLAEARRLLPPDLAIAFIKADLAASLADILAEPADIVTASALVDLVSLDWLERLLDLLPAGAALYLALTYDGREHWSPTHDAERLALEAFHTHMRRDKGFGPALGAEAAETLVDVLQGRGWTVHSAKSPWELGPTEQALITALADGSAAAVAETGRLDTATLGDWHVARRKASRVEIGHCDIFATPPTG
ncbi:MAG: methyltransferase domain-containing protein [Pseudomonadota bacterium]